MKQYVGLSQSQYNTKTMTENLPSSAVNISDISLTIASKLTHEGNTKHIAMQSLPVLNDVVLHEICTGRAILQAALQLETRRVGHPTGPCRYARTSRSPHSEPGAATGSGCARSLEAFDSVDETFTHAAGDGWRCPRRRRHATASMRARTTGHVRSGAPTTRPRARGAQATVGR